MINSHDATSSVNLQKFFRLPFELSVVDMMISCNTQYLYQNIRLYAGTCLQVSGFLDALEDDQLLAKPDCVVKMLSVIALALQSQTNTASTTYLLNTIRTSALLTRHLIPFFTRMPAEHSMQRQRTFRRAIKARNKCITCKSHTLVHPCSMFWQYKKERRRMK